jgi:hypothetical protein
MVVIDTASPRAVQRSWMKLEMVASTADNGRVPRAEGPNTRDRNGPWERTPAALQHHHSLPKRVVVIVHARRVTGGARETSAARHRTDERIQVGLTRCVFSPQLVALVARPVRLDTLVTAPIRLVN